MLKQALKIKNGKSVLGTVKDKLPKPVEVIDDLVVVLILCGYAYGRIAGMEVFPEWTLVAAVSYALGKELNV